VSFRSDARLDDLVSKRATDERVVDELVCRVLGWRLAPGRYIKSGRRWIPQWRFQPLTNIDDAFQLLNAGAGSLVLKTTKDGSYAAQVKLGQRTGRATAPSVASSITVAIARAIGLDVPDEPLSSLATKSLRRHRQGQAR
jgi:hypothetical protein